MLDIGENRDASHLLRRGVGMQGQVFDVSICTIGWKRRTLRNRLDPMMTHER
jgi:hypothetical protein